MFIVPVWVDVYFSDYIYLFKVSDDASTTFQRVIGKVNYRHPQVW